MNTLSEATHAVGAGVGLEGYVALVGILLVAYAAAKLMGR